jgi:hypothetical protein
MFMALATAVLNGAAAVLTKIITNADVAQFFMALTGLCSPFLSIYLLKLYIRADDPPELTRQISALEASIKVCKRHLKDKGASPDFQRETRAQLEDFQRKLQSVRADFEQGRTHVITPFAGDNH